MANDPTPAKKIHPKHTQHTSKMLNGTAEDSIHIYDPVADDPDPIPARKTQHKQTCDSKKLNSIAEDSTHIYDPDPAEKTNHKCKHDSEMLNVTAEDSTHIYDAVADDLNPDPAEKSQMKHGNNISVSSTKDSNMCGPIVTLLMPYDT